MEGVEEYEKRAKQKPARSEKTRGLKFDQSTEAPLNGFQEHITSLYFTKVALEASEWGKVARPASGCRGKVRRRGDPGLKLGWRCEGRDAVLAGSMGWGVA